MTIQIAVTQQDIIAGRRGSCRTCPLARALNRALLAAGIAQEDDEVRVFTRTWELHRIMNLSFMVSLLVRGELPAHVRKFVSDFDSAAPVLPFSFALESLKGEV